MTKMLEGSWEEIAARASEWQGRQVRLEVLDAPSQNGSVAPEEDGLTPYERVKHIIGSVEGGPDDLGERSEEYFAQLMDEKYARDQEKARDRFK